LLCGKHSATQIELALKACSHTALQDHLAKTVPQTLRQRRIQECQNHAVPVPKGGPNQNVETG
jgi:hypothetical protein